MATLPLPPRYRSDVSPEYLLRYFRNAPNETRERLIERDGITIEDIEFQRDIRTRTYVFHARIQFASGSRHWFEFQVNYEALEFGMEGIEAELSSLFWESMQNSEDYRMYRREPARGRTRNVQPGAMYLGAGRLMMGSQGRPTQEIGNVNNLTINWRDPDPQIMKLLLPDPPVQVKAAPPPGLRTMRVAPKQETPVIKRATLKLRR